MFFSRKLWWQSHVCRKIEGEILSYEKSIKNEVMEDWMKWKIHEIMLNFDRIESTHPLLPAEGTQIISSGFRLEISLQ